MDRLISEIVPLQIYIETSKLFNNYRFLHYNSLLGSVIPLEIFILVVLLRASAEK